MDDREYGRADHVRLPRPKAPQQNSQEQTAEECFFDERDDHGGRNRQGNGSPRGICAERIKAAGDEKDFAQENR